jgi:thiamine-monophosphate kinase
MRLSEIGEAELVQRIFGRLPCGRGVIQGAGDDAAVLDLGGGLVLLFTIDTLVENVHFSRAYTSFRDLGYKALAVNLSDIAAMGGRPGQAVVSLAVPADTRVEDVEELYAGLGEAASGYGVFLVGGDTVRHPDRLVVTVALLGVADRGRVLYRRGAAPGDLFYVTGALGGSAAGLFLLQNPDLECPPDIARRLKAAHLRPAPRVAVGGILAASGAVTAAEDISDGLTVSVAHLCGASGTGCLLRAGSLPVSDAVLALGRLAGKDPLEWALSGGEDYELLFTVRPEAAAGLEARLAAAGWTVTPIGEVLAPDAGLWIEGTDGKRRLLTPAGYDAFYFQGV